MGDSMRYVRCILLALYFSVAPQQCGCVQSTTAAYVSNPPALARIRIIILAHDFYPSLALLLPQNLLIKSLPSRQPLKERAAHPQAPHCRADWYASLREPFDTH